MKKQNGTTASVTEPTPLAEAADDIVKNHVLLSSAAGLFLSSGLDIAAVTGIQYRMVKKLAEVYEVPFEEQEVRTVLNALSFSTVARLFSSGASTLFNPNKQFGKWSKALTNAAVMGFFTGVVGKVYSLHFERGGGLEGLGLDMFVELAQEQVRNGELNPATIFSFSSRIWQSL